MKKLLYKEFRLAAHPTTYLFPGLSAMVLIPSYPYYITFFYTTLSLFFICLGGRENHDIAYTALLPVKKRDLVTARFLLATLTEFAQILLVVLFILLRTALRYPGNPVGMDANIAFLGISLLLLGLFNLIFFTCYYRNPEKIGVPFLAGTLAFTFAMLAAEAAVHALPFAREVLDTPDPLFFQQKLVVLAAGLALFFLLTGVSYQLSVRSFESLDL